MSYGRTRRTSERSVGVHIWRGRFGGEEKSENGLEFKHGKGAAAAAHVMSSLTSTRHVAPAKAARIEIEGPGSEGGVLIESHKRVELSATEGKKRR
jgi:hypothetical protein